MLERSKNIPERLEATVHAAQTVNATHRMEKGRAKRAWSLAVRADPWDGPCAERAVRHLWHDAVSDAAGLLDRLDAGQFCDLVGD